MQTYAAISSDPLIWAVGWTIGHEIARTLSSQNLTDLLNELTNLWANLRFGEVTVDVGRPLTFVFDNCYGCFQVPGSSRMRRCPLQEGVLKAIFDEKLGTDSTVRHTALAVDSKGLRHCEFQVST